MVVWPWLVLELSTVLALTQLGIRQSDWWRAGIRSTNLHIVVELLIILLNIDIENITIVFPFVHLFVWYEILGIIMFKEKHFCYDRSGFFTVILLMWQFIGLIREQNPHACYISLISKTISYHKKFLFNLYAVIIASWMISGLSSCKLV